MYPLLEPHLTTYNSNIGVQIRLVTKLGRSTLVLGSTSHGLSRIAYYSLQKKINVLLLSFNIFNIYSIEIKFSTDGNIANVGGQSY